LADTNEIGSMLTEMEKTRYCDYCSLNFSGISWSFKVKVRTVNLKSPSYFLSQYTLHYRITIVSFQDKFCR
jgi:hypothetical protein